MKPSEYLHENGVQCERNRILHMLENPSEEMVRDVASALTNYVAEAASRYMAEYDAGGAVISVDFGRFKPNEMAKTALPVIAKHLRNIETTPRREE